jgi:uncharacterized membrane protein YqaE (UPF0057 family)
MTRLLGVLLGTFIPPVGVYLVKGFALSFWLNVLLSLLFFVPGQLHALWIVAHTRADGRPAPNGTTTFIALLLATWLPPVGVLWKRGIGLDLLLNIVLTAFFWIPGSIHALYVVVDD